MYPHKMRPARMRGHPCFGALDDVAATAFNASPAFLRRRVFREVIVELESSVESGSKRLAVENDCPNECCGAITVLGEQLGHRVMRGCERNAEISDAM